MIWKLAYVIVCFERVEPVISGYPNVYWLNKEYFMDIDMSVLQDINIAQVKLYHKYIKII